VISDFELEFQMALTNRSLVPEIDTICLITSQQYNFISSSIVKEVALLHGDVSGMVTPAVARALYAKADGGTNVNIVSLRD
jgi:pantetheine-phosphate adenylyltransferase